MNNFYKGKNIKVTRIPLYSRIVTAIPLKKGTSKKITKIKQFVSSRAWSGMLPIFSPNWFISLLLIIHIILSIILSRFEVKISTFSPSALVFSLLVNSPFYSEICTNLNEICRALNNRSHLYTQYMYHRRYVSTFSTTINIIKQRQPVYNCVVSKNLSIELTLQNRLWVITTAQRGRRGCYIKLRHLTLRAFCVNG